MSQEQIFDVAVIGGGIVGLSIAYRVRQRGRRVAVFDAGAMAAEASTAGAGMLSPGGEAHRVSDWTRDAVAARSLYGGFVDELRRQSGLQIDYRECGAVEVASDDAAWAQLLARAAVQRELGIALEQIDERQVRQLVPRVRPGSLRGFHYPDDASMDPRHITAALIALLEQAQVPLLEGRRVTELAKDGEGYLLRTAEGDVHAGVAVVAAGPWSNEIRITPQPPAPAPRRAFPIRGHLICCNHTPGTLEPIVREGKLYAFQRTDGEVVSGSTEELVGFDRELNPAMVEDILQRTNQLLPGLFPAQPPVDAWSGFRPGIEGEGPEVRQLGEERIWLAYGHYRNGLLLAPHTAQKVANEICA